MRKRVKKLYLHTHTFLPSSADTFLTSHSAQTLPPSPLELYVSYLKDVYKNDPLPAYDKWPQVKGKKFINLSLLSKCEVSPQEAHKYTKAMFHGHISSIAPEKKMEMADIAKTDNGSIIKGRRKCILVEGAPGVGKSTFAWKLCRQWSKGKILQQYRLVVLLSLREKRVREKTKAASDLFRRCEPTAIEGICRSGGEGVLLVLDGWDELPAELRGKDSFFLDLVQGQELPDATVVVTSRPHASEVIVSECQDRIFQHIEIMGFSQGNVLVYMRSSAGDDAKLLQGLQTYTSCYPHIRSMMYNPLNAAIVVEVYKNSWKEESTIPKTLTELYSSLIRTLLLRYLREHPVHCNRKWTRRLRQFSDLPPDVYQQLYRVSRVAYEGISNNQQVIFSDLPEDFDSLGLMQCVPELYVDEGAALSYNFLHLTVQEFLAAFHLSQQSTEEQIEIFKLHMGTSIYLMVLKFLAGLTSFKGFSAGTLLSILTSESPISSRVKLDLDGLHFLFEAKKVLNDLSEVDFVSLYPPSFSPFDCYVLGYIASHTSCKWTIHVVRPGHRYICEMFASGTMEDGVLCASVAQTVCFTFFSSLSGTLGLRQLLTAHPSFLARTAQLHLIDNGLDSHSCDLLSQSLPSLPHLQSLELSANAIGSTVVPTPSLPSSSTTSSADNEKGNTGHPFSLYRSFLKQTLSPQKYTSLPPSEHTPIQFHPPSAMSSPPHPSVQLIKTLHSHNILKSLELFNTSIGLSECAALAQWLSSPTCSLEVLDIGGNSLTSEATELIITTLCQNCTLRGLSISGSEIASQLLTPVVCLPLVKVDLIQCHIGPEGACEIARTLNSNTVLEELYLSYNPIGDRGATALADMLLHNRTLKTLHLYSTSLTARGTQALLQSLQHNDTLRKIWLSKQSLTTNTNGTSKYEVVWV